MRLRGRHYATGELVELVCGPQGIEYLGPAGTGPIDEEADWLAPALCDIQINGCAGHNFTSARLTIEEIYEVVRICQQHGLAALCPTVITAPFPVLAHSLATLRRACEADPALAAALPAFHLEGPYLSPEDGPRGAHPRAWIRPPDWEEFCRLQDCAGGRIRLVTLAPEYDQALSFIERLVAQGVVVALGHTAATPQRIREAIAAGARLSTHLGNGCHLLLPRHDNYLWEQLAADELWASLICDGHHLPPALIRCLVRAKTPARVLLTCDASPLAGLPPGRYQEWGQTLEVLPDGRIRLADDQRLAGSSRFTDTCVRNVLRYATVTLAEAVDMATVRPRQLLGLPLPRLDRGAPADLILFDWQPGETWRLRATVLGGRLIRPAPEP